MSFAVSAFDQILPCSAIFSNTLNPVVTGSKLGLGDIDFFVYHDTLGGYHDIPDILVEFKLLEIKVTLKLN